MAHPDTKLFRACNSETRSHPPGNKAQMDPEAGERAMLYHLQLKCQLPLDRGCFFEVAGWMWSSELPGGGLQERRYVVWLSTELHISADPFNSFKEEAQAADPTWTQVGELLKTFSETTFIEH